MAGEDEAKQREANIKHLVLLAVAIDGLLLQLAPPSLQDDLKVVMTAVRQNGWGLQYASERLQNNLSVVSASAFQAEWPVVPLPPT